MTRKRVIIILASVLIVMLFAAAATSIYNLTAVSVLADGDLLVVVDVSDSAQSANGSTRKVTAENLGDYIQSMWSSETAQFSGVGIGEAGVAAQLNSNAALTIDLDDQDLTVDCGTAKTLVLATPVWDDLRVAPFTAGLGPQTDSPDVAKWLDNGGGSAGNYLYWFDATADEEIYFDAQLPHTYYEGSDIYFHVHWVPDTTADGTPANQEVEWGIEYVWVDFGDTAPANTTIAYGSTHSPADANVVADKHYITSVATITGTSKNVSSILSCRFFRNADGANDDYEHDAGLLACDFHFQVDTMGSRQETSK